MQGLRRPRGRSYEAMTESARVVLSLLLSKIGNALDRSWFCAHGRRTCCLRTATGRLWQRLRSGVATSGDAVIGHGAVAISAVDERQSDFAGQASDVARACRDWYQDCGQ